MSGGRKQPADFLPLNQEEYDGTIPKDRQPSNPIAGDL